MRFGSRFQLNSTFLLAVIFGLAFLIIGTPAQAGCFGKLFGRHRAAACSSGGYSSYQSYGYSQTAAAAPCAPCGQTASYGYNQSYNYGYATAPAAPCAPCGQTANYAPSAPAPVYYPTQAPPVYSAPPVPQTGLRWNCNGTSCTLIR